MEDTVLSAFTNINLFNLCNWGRCSSYSPLTDAGTTLQGVIYSRSHGASVWVYSLALNHCASSLWEEESHITQDISKCPYPELVEREEGPFQLVKGSRVTQPSRTLCKEENLSGPSKTGATSLCLWSTWSVA